MNIIWPTVGVSESCLLWAHAETVIHPNVFVQDINESCVCFSVTNVFTCRVCEWRGALSVKTVVSFYYWLKITLKQAVNFGSVVWLLCVAPCSSSLGNNLHLTIHMRHIVLLCICSTCPTHTHTHTSACVGFEGCCVSGAVCTELLLLGLLTGLWQLSVQTCPPLSVTWHVPAIPAAAAAAANLH